MIIELSREDIEGAEVLASREADCNQTNTDMYIRVLRLSDGRIVAAECFGSDPEYIELGECDPEQVIKDAIGNMIMDAHSNSGLQAAIELGAMWGEISKAHPYKDQECYVLGTTGWYGGYNTYRAIGDDDGKPITYAEAEQKILELEAAQLEPYGCPTLSYNQSSSETYTIVRAQ